MSTTTSIAWTDHTFNAWWGCTKVHAGCAHCYALSWDLRWGGDHWGKDATRRMIVGEWGKPAQWDTEAAKAGRPCLVFASSMCDVFEDYPESRPVVDQQGKPIPVPAKLRERLDLNYVYVPRSKEDPGAGGDWCWNVPSLRARLFDIFEPMRNTILLLLTKRPENITRMVPKRWLDNWPAHVWTGTSPCNYETAEKSIPPLIAVPGNHFLSCEPLLGNIILERRWIETAHGTRRGIDWVICGGESRQRGKCREFPVEYAIELKNQCEAFGVPFFMKQMGSMPTCVDGPLDLASPKGDDPSEWPLALRVQQFPKEFRR